MAVYSKMSPYYGTSQENSYLDTMVNRSIPKKTDDVVYTIDAIYNRRPDLLAFDLYGDARLWWVFAQRNPNVLQDPVFDFLPGVTIYIPKKETLVTALGL